MTTTDPLYTSARSLGDVVGTSSQGSYGGALPQGIEGETDVGVGGREGAGLTASTALLVLRAGGCEYVPDLSVPDGAWIGRCPLCRLPRALRIWEQAERIPGEEASLPWASAFCRRGCNSAVVREFLLTPLRVIEAEERERQAWAHYGWAVDFTQRLLEVC